MSISSNLRCFAFSLVYHQTSPWDEIHAYQSFKQHAYIIFAALWLWVKCCCNQQLPFWTWSHFWHSISVGAGDSRLHKNVKIIVVMQHGAVITIFHIWATSPGFQLCHSLCQRLIVQNNCCPLVFHHVGVCVYTRVVGYEKRQWVEWRATDRALCGVTPLYKPQATLLAVCGFNNCLQPMGTFKLHTFVQSWVGFLQSF